MPESYSLVRRAWLPVALSDGRREFVRPCDITSRIDGQDIVRLATGRPDCDISLTEFLIGLLAVAMGPTSHRDWGARYTTPPTGAELEAAFTPLEVAMMLDGDGPRFFQDREAFEFGNTEKDWNRPDQLFVDGPGDNTIKENADHFVKRGGVSCLSRAGAAIAVLSIQTMSPSGGPGKLTSVRGGGPLTTIVVPGANGEPSLWQRLWANVPNKCSDSPQKFERVFPWLVATRNGAKGGIKTTPEDVDLAQAFFGLPRRIRLIFERNTTGLKCDLLGTDDDWVVLKFVDKPKGTDYGAWSRAHPLSPYYKVKPADLEFLPLHLKSSRVGYRQWLGMVTQAQGGMRVPAKCLTTFPERGAEVKKLHPNILKRARLLVAGYAMDNMKPLDFAEALLPLIVSDNPDANEQIKILAHNWVQAADTVASQLVSSVKLGVYGENGKADGKSTPLEAVKSRFWADTENDFYETLRASADAIETYDGDYADTAELFAKLGAGWLPPLKRHALKIFDDAVPIADADSDRIIDIIAGRKMLGLMLAGFGRGGAALFSQLSQPSPESKPSKRRKAA
jgi:CRISPR system Cascade subunit CasA